MGVEDGGKVDAGFQRATRRAVETARGTREMI